MVRISNATAVAAVRGHKVFVNNSTTLVGTVRFCGWGDLPDAYRTEFLQTGRDVVYWIYSYDTPIAWIFADLTVEMPKVDYSPTTTTHQELVAEALDFHFHAEDSIRVGSGTARPGVECDSARSTVRRRRILGRSRIAGIGLG
jgi:hypothetical protein